MKSLKLSARSISFQKNFATMIIITFQNYWIVFLVCLKLQILCGGSFHVLQVLECDTLLNVKILLE